MVAIDNGSPKGDFSTGQCNRVKLISGGEEESLVRVALLTESTAKLSSFSTFL